MRGPTAPATALPCSSQTLVQQLEQFVLRNYPIGLKWDPVGPSLEEVVKGGAAAPKPTLPNRSPRLQQRMEPARWPLQ